MNKFLQSWCAPRVPHDQRKEVITPMLGSDFDRAVAMLCFLDAYLKEIREEASMKAKNEREKREASAAPPSPKQRWPARRRFWHRAPSKLAPAPAPQPPRSGIVPINQSEHLIETLR